MKKSEWETIKAGLALADTYQEQFRLCDECNTPIIKGYIYADGAFCSFTCMPVTEAEWLATVDDESENYYTEWADLTDD